MPSPGLARAHAARAYAAVDQGDTAQAQISLDALKRTFDRLPNDTHGQSALAFRESQLRWTEAYVHTQTGDKKAEVTLTQALALYPTDAVTPAGNLRLMQAAYLVRAREIDAGLQQAITTMQGHLRPVSSGTTILVGNVLRALPDQARALPAARDLRALASSQT
ncbi:hypothetical protein ACGFNU_41835 [Spirillospora sp. NPDC048911]|uniref:hypothetical protein n=1 Tax=Spirillospora sp. NPDC048911 TaxID=3364527 RepID=UPI003720DD47